MANIRDLIKEVRDRLQYAGLPRNPLSDLEEKFEEANPRVRAEMERRRTQIMKREMELNEMELNELELQVQRLIGEQQRQSPPIFYQSLPGLFPPGMLSPPRNPFAAFLPENATPPLDRAKLAALKTATPHRVYQKAPDRIEVITAWRAWGVEDLRLKALGQKTVWEPRKQVDAACVSDFKRSDHPAPNRDCQCGVWAFKSLDRLVPALNAYTGVRVLGQVSLWGRVIETENGFRAQHAYPSELWLLDESLEELGYIYDVPVRTAP